MSSKRASWNSNIGFLMATIGSAVGLGNIWCFPFKMGKSGGFAFLLIYLVLAAVVGVTIMLSELAIGRMTGKGVVGAYQDIAGKFKWVGWLGLLAPFLILSFYTVLGGYCIQYMSLNLSELAFGLSGIYNTPITGEMSFGAMLTNPIGGVFFTLLFMLLCALIVAGGIEDGIEKFNKVGMPMLFVMLVIIIARSVTLPNAVEGLKFMFVPGYAVEAGFIDEMPSLITILGTAGGQMFFSLSLAMGIIVTYGSYLKKEENLVKNSLVIVGCDSIIAIMAGLAVIPASVSNGMASGLTNAEIAAGLGGPKLLFVTLQVVFANMGTAGAFFGVVFYLFVLMAALTSAISIMEVLVTFALDRAEKKNKTVSARGRKKVALGVTALVAIEASLVAVDGLGSNGVWVPFQETFGIAMWNDCWLDFMDCWSEGIAMPLGAMIMSLMIGWELQPKFILHEVREVNYSPLFGTFFSISMKFIVPVVMAFILSGQMISFFATPDNMATVSTVCYVICGSLLAFFWVVAMRSGKNAPEYDTRHHCPAAKQSQTSSI